MKSSPTPAGFGLPIACALLGAALLALALLLRPGAADARRRADLARADLAELAPDLAAQDRYRDALLAATARTPSRDPAAHLAARGVAATSAAPLRERPLRGNAFVLVRETSLSVPSADLPALALAVADAEADGHRLVSASVDPAPGGRVKAALLFRAILAEDP